MKLKIHAVGVLAVFVFLGMFASEAVAEAIKMRIVVVNPSTDKTQKKDVKKYLPKEIQMQHVKDAGGLEIAYDEEQGLFYVHKEAVELAPLETKTFELVMEDVWNVPEEELRKLRTDTERVTAALSDSVYFAQADLVAKTIYGRLDEILREQKDPNISRMEHIANYRDNAKVLAGVKEDIDKLEKILVAVGGPPNLELIEESDINLQSPTSKTTWIIIFVVLIFIGILAGTFYFTWHHQARITENIFTRESDSSYSEFKKKEGGGPEKGAS
jgi:hypothetical protein